MRCQIVKRLSFLHFFCKDHNATHLPQLTVARSQKGLQPPASLKASQKATCEKDQGLAYGKSTYGIKRNCLDNIESILYFILYIIIYIYNIYIYTLYLRRIVFGASSLLALPDLQVSLNSGLKSSPAPSSWKAATKQPPELPCDSTNLSTHLQESCVFVHRSWNVDSQRYSPEREVRITYTLWSAVFCFLQSLLIWILNMNFLQPDQAIPAFSCIQLPFFPGFSVIWTCCFQLWMIPFDAPGCSRCPTDKPWSSVDHGDSADLWTAVCGCRFWYRFCMIFEFLYDFWKDPSIPSWVTAESRKQTTDCSDET